MAVESITSEPVLDVEGTLARFGGDKQLFVEMAGMLLEDAPLVFDDLRAAVKANDAIAVRGRAHALKGLLAGCGGVRAAKVAQGLEDAGSKSNLTDANSLLEDLNRELDELTRTLRQYCV